MVTGTHKKRFLIIAGTALVSIFAALSLADFLGFLPSLPRTLGNCKTEATKQLVSVHRYDNRPIDDPENSEWYAKHAELLSSCMESHGYKLDEHAAAVFVGRLMKTEVPSSTGGTIEYDEDVARQLETFWHRRWFWE